MDFLTVLPVELIHKILDYVSTFDILTSVFLVNKRLRSVSMAYRRFQPNFSTLITSINKNQFDYICTQLTHLTTQIESLTLFDKDDPLTPTKNALFFQRFCNLDRTFSNLHTLNLTYITHDIWCLLKSQLPLTIVTLTIHLVNTNRFVNSLTTSIVLHELLFFSPILKYLTIKMSNYSNEIITVQQSKSINLSPVQYFNLEGIIIDLSSLFVIAPMLHTLEINSRHSTRVFNKLCRPAPVHLQRLTLKLCSVTWMQLSTLLSSFPRLNYLTIVADDLDDDMANGFAWARLLQQIKHFECKLQFSWGAFAQQPINLNSFRTSFWVEEKQWFIIYSQNSTTGYPMLYSNSSSSTTTDPSQDVIGIVASDSSNSQQKPLFDIHYLTMNYQYLKYGQLHRCTRIKQINSLSYDVTIPIVYQDLIKYLEVSRIITCFTSPEWITKSPLKAIEFLQSIPQLRALSISVSILDCFFAYQWPHTTHLRIEQDFDDDFYVLSSSTIDAVCQSFIRLRRLDIHLACVDNLVELLNKINKTNISDILIRQPRIINENQCITYAWIKQNTTLEDFHYARDIENTVSLWL